MKRRRNSNALDAIRYTGKVLNHNEVGLLLEKVEVRDALKFVIAVGNDPRFVHIRKEMNKERIWKYWMNRDMKIVMNLIQHKLPQWATMYENKLQIRRMVVTVPESVKPSWKLVYLWYSLVIGGLQWSIIKQHNRKLRDAYPYDGIQDTKIEYMYLNTFRVSNSIQTTVSDFRTQWPQMVLTFSNRRDIGEYMEYNIHNLFSHAKVNYGTFITERYNIKTWMEIHPSINHIDALTSLYRGLEERQKYGVDKTQYNQQELYDFPRIIESTKILIGNNICAACGKEDSKWQCKECKSTVYCSRVCQKSDWATHKNFC
ncbi:zinc finger MYND domain-containing protein [Flavobacteriaceae bacterium]|nr:zinc finger MYND domain-containing protein [Flavobacteriaceae bacterium]